MKTIPVASSVYMLVGAGGNIGVSAGDDGLLIVDDQFKPLGQEKEGIGWGEVKPSQRESLCRPYPYI